LRRRRRRRRIALPPVLDQAAVGPSPQYVHHLRQSMQAWDAMPEEFRRFCADYPRTAPAGQLAEVLAVCGGDVARAERLLRELLPVADA
jgi:hypothetical protein